MEAVHLDTHIVVWLNQAERRRIARIERRLKTAAICVSPAVAFELQFLYEIGRIRADSEAILVELEQTAGLLLASTAFSGVVRQANRLQWCRDPFDRLIVGNAQAEDAPLLTADERISDRYVRAIHY